MLLALVAAGEIALLRDLDGIWIVVAALPLAAFAVLRMIGGPAPVRAVTLVSGRSWSRCSRCSGWTGPGRG